MNAVTSTSGALGLVDVGTSGTETQTLDLDFGGVSGNAFRFGVTGSQINLHNLTVYGAVGAVPEPMTWMMLILGFLGIGGLMRRKNAAARPSTLRVTYS